MLADVNIYPFTITWGLQILAFRMVLWRPYKDYLQMFKFCPFECTAFAESGKVGLFTLKKKFCWYRVFCHRTEFDLFFFVLPAKHCGTQGSLCPASVGVYLSDSHPFLVVTHSYVWPATHAFLRMLQLFFSCIFWRGKQWGIWHNLIVLWHHFMLSAIHK